MPFCKYCTTPCSRNAGCDLSFSSYRKVPHLKETQTSYWHKKPKISYKQPHTAPPCKWKPSLSNSFSNCKNLSTAHHPSPSQEGEALGFFLTPQPSPLLGISWTCSRSGGGRRAGSRWWQTPPGAAASPSQRCSPGNPPTWPTPSPARRAFAQLQKKLCLLPQTCVVTSRNMSFIWFRSCLLV